MTSKKLSIREITTVLKLSGIQWLRGVECEDPSIGYKVDEVRALYESYQEELDALYILLGIEE